MSLCINPECQKPKNSDTTIFCPSCGSELLLDGRYRVVGELGQGGFGKTYEIVDVNSQPKVLKVLMDNHPKYVELFQQEAQILSTMHHSGIPKIDLNGYFLYYLRQKEEPLHCLVMEKIEGLNLDEYIYQRGNRPIKPTRALRWLAELILILEQVHNQNFFHRDIKPANIMLRANGTLVLIDFGTAREVNETYLHKQAVGEVTGVVTQGYTPNEQKQGKAVLQSDFYALGSTMIFLLTAKNPRDFYNFSSNKFNWQQATEGVPPQLVDLIDRMMAFSPSNRPVNCREIFNQIVAIDPSLQILDEHFDRGSHSGVIDRSFPSQSHLRSTPITNKTSSITPEFVQRCRRELAEFIGPMATIICDRTLKQNSALSEEELCMALAKTISNPEQAKTFRQRCIK